MNEIQNENNRPDDKKRISADVKRYLIPVLGVSLVAVTLCGVGYLYFSPAPAEKVTVAVNDLTDDGTEKTAEEAAAEAFDALTPLTPQTETDKPKIVVSQEEPSLVETTPVETAQTDYSRIEIPETAQPAARPKPQPAAPAPKPAVQSQPKTTPQPAVRTPAAAPQPKKTSPRFYIQAGSFSTLANAERAQQMLADKEIRSIIETRNIGGKTWYRVLVGAYASKDEANRFKPTVQAVKGFEEAMIREYY